MAFVRKKTSVDKVIQQAAKEAAEAAIEGQFEEMFTGDSPPSTENFNAIPLQQEEEAPSHIDSLLAGCPNSEGYYIKLYREVSPAGKCELKMRIDDYSHWTDMEYEIHRIVAENTKKDPKQWGSGRYKIMIFREGEAGFKRRPQVFDISVPKDDSLPVPPIGTMQGSQDFRSKLNEMTEFMAMLKALTPQQQSQLNPTEIGKMMMDSLNQGIAVAKASAPPPQAERKEKSLAETIAELKALGVIKPDKTPMEQYKELEAMGMVKKEQTLLEQIETMKALGLIPDKAEKKEEPSIIDKLKELKEFKELIGDTGGGNKDTSMVEKAIEIGLPIVGQALSNAAAALGEYFKQNKEQLEIQRLELELRLGKVALPQKQRALPQAQIPPPDAREKPITKEGKDMPLFVHPKVRELWEVVESSDTEAFPEIEQSIIELIPNEQGYGLIEQLRSGEATPANLTEMLNKMVMYGYDFNNPKSIAYINEFIAYLKTKILAVCNKCGAEYEFPNKEAVEADKKCPETGCDGELVIPQ